MVREMLYNLILKVSLFKLFLILYRVQNLLELSLIEHSQVQNKVFSQ